MCKVSETLLRFDCSVLFAGPTGRLSPPGHLALWFQDQIPNTPSGLMLPHPRASWEQML